MFKLQTAKELMKKTNPRWIASNTGKCKATIHNYLNGVSSPDKSTAIAWALALGLQPLDLWDEQAEMQSKMRKKSA